MTLPQSCLIIDDDEAVGAVLCRHLRNYLPDARILWANHFAPPIDPVDVIVLDLFLRCPMEDTLESLKARWRDLPPVIGITGKSDAAQAMEACIRAGAEDFISKDAAIENIRLLADKIIMVHLRRRVHPSAPPVTEIP